MRLIVNDIYMRLPVFPFLFDQLPSVNGKMENLLYTRNDDFMIVTATDLCKSILISITVIFTIYFFLNLISVRTH